MNLPEALQSGNIEEIRKVPKSDLHNHGMMGGRHHHLQTFYGSTVNKFSNGKKGVHGINEWIKAELQPVFGKEGAVRFALESSFRQALEDGVTVLEMSVDGFMGNLFGIKPSEMVRMTAEVHNEIAPGVDFRPELGFPRTLPLRTIIPIFDKYLETGFFRSIDLYDIEDAQPVENFREYYRFAKKAGLKCKAHAGEFGDAESVRKAVEILDLDAVQHGIGAAGSDDVMKWLADRGTLLNVCPESNIILCRAESYKTHPIRILYDHGVKVTINTDDVLLFDVGNSEQYQRLYESGAFTSAELDEIRLNGLNEAKR